MMSACRPSFQPESAIFPITPRRQVFFSPTQGGMIYDPRALYLRRFFVYYAMYSILSLRMWRETYIWVESAHSFPVLFVNKQIHAELLRLIHFNLGPVKICGYHLRKCKGPDEFQQLSYPTKWPWHPHVQLFARKVWVTLTYGKCLNRNWVWDGSWYYLTLNYPGHIVIYDPTWSVISELVKYLSTYESLLELEIIIRDHQSILNTVPEIVDFDRLLPLYDLCGTRIVFIFKTGPLFQCDNPLEKVAIG
jgi:hypothetical protein